MILGSDRGLGISRFEPLWRPDTVWYVFDETGDPAATVPVPPDRGSRITAVDGDRVLLVSRDRFDVSSVERAGDRSLFVQ